MTATEDSLAGALGPTDRDNFEDGTAADALAEWAVDDLDEAQWAARKLTRARHKIDEYRRLHEDIVARADQWITRETEALVSDQAFFETRLEAFHRAALDADPKAKTIRLPDGTELASNAGRLAVEIDDADALVRWAEENEVAEELLEYPEPKPKKAEVAARYGTKAGDEPGEYPAVIADTGEVVPGVKIVRRPRSYTARTPKEGA